MKLNPDLELSTDDFWYDLTQGGYFKLEDMLENPADVAKVRQAIAVLKEFESSCEEQIPDFYR